MNNNNNIYSNVRLQSGLTLTEIMIAMSITLFMLTGVIAVYASSKQVFRVQKNMSHLQENARFSLDYLGKNIRMAGYVGCQRLQPNEVLEDVVSGIRLNSDNDLMIYEYDGTNWNADLPVTVNNIKLDSDILTVARGEVVEYPLIRPMTNEASSIHIGSDYDLENNDVLLISNCSNKEIFTVSSIDSSGEIMHPPLQNRYGDDTDGDGIPNDHAVIMKFSAYMYYIHDEGDGEYALHRRDMITGSDEEMVEGVDDMQITITVDNDNPDAVESVTVNLLMRSLDNGVSTKDTTATDKYMRKSYNITINKRN